MAIVVGVVATGWFFHLLRQAERDTYEAEFSYLAGNNAEEYREAWAHVDAAGELLGGVIGGADRFDSDGARYFAERVRAHHPEIHWVGWLSHGGFGGVEAPAEYLPLLPMVGLAGHEDGHRQHLAREPGVAAAILGAIDTGTPVYVKLTGLQGAAEGPGVLAVYPVYRGGRVPDTGEVRPENMLGVVCVWVVWADFVETVIAEIPPRGIDIAMVDESARPEQRMLYFHPSRTRRDRAEAVSEAEFAAGFLVRSMIRGGGGEWTFLARPAPSFKPNSESVLPASGLVLSGGGLLTAMLGSYLVVGVRRQRSMEEVSSRLSQTVGMLSEAQRIAKTGSWSLDLGTGQLSWSEEIYKLCELDPASTLPTYELFLDLVHPEDRSMVHRAFTESLALTRGYDLVHRIVMTDGRIKYVHERGHAIYEGDKAVRAVGIAHDVTERRDAELSMRKAAAVFESASEGIVVTELDGTVVDVNRAFTAMMGYAAEEVRGHNPRLWKSESHSAQFFDAMWTSIRTNGGWQGELWNRRKNGEIFPVWLAIGVVKEPEGNPVQYVGVMTDISRLKASQAELERLAHYDGLTGLPNRIHFGNYLRDVLIRAERDNESLAVLFIDLDRFKHINDSLGHETGDRLLQAVVERIAEQRCEGELVARMGGDEFTILLERLRCVEDAEAVAKRLGQALHEPFRLDEHELQITSSIGISIFPRDGVTVDTLLKNADAAMYRAKASGRNTYRFYCEQFTEAARDRVQLGAELWHAMDRNQLHLHYQPQVDLVTGRVVGAEALLRWSHPGMGSIPPDRFIRVAEDTGQIVRIGEWVLTQACTQGRQWLDRGLVLDCLSVNVSLVQMRRSEFVDVVGRVLEATGFPREKLVLEVTETVFMDDAEDVLAKLYGLKALGVSIAIDDFGTGYSSLGYLKRLPIDELKIDKSFVRDVPGDANGEAIVRAITALGMSMGVRVIAEGIENWEQREFLCDEGCARGQGYLYARPMPPEDFASLIESPELSITPAAYQKALR